MFFFLARLGESRLGHLRVGTTAVAWTGMAVPSGFLLFVLSTTANLQLLDSPNPDGILVRLRTC